MIKVLLSVFGYLGIIAKVAVFLYLFYLFIPLDLFAKSVNNNFDSRKRATPVKKEDFLSMAIIVMLVQLILWQIPATTFPISVLGIIGVAVPFSLIRFKDHITETIYVISLWWCLRSVSFFIINTLTNWYSDYLMKDILTVSNVEEYVEVRTGIIQISVEIMYVCIIVLAIIPIKRIIKRYETIDWNDLAYLLVPNILGILITWIMISIIIIVVDGTPFILMEQKPELLFILPILALLIYLGTVVALLRFVKSQEAKRTQQLYFTEHLEKEAFENRLQETIRVNEQVRSVKHEIVNHFANIKALVDDGQYEALAEYITNLDVDISKIDSISFTGNAIIDVILNDKMAKANEQDITINMSVGFNDAWGIQAYDIGIIISNLLDNAIKAVQDYDGVDKIITFSILSKSPVIIICCENPYSDENKNQTETQLWHGLGLKNIESIANRYNGTMRVEGKNGRFMNTVMLKAQF